MRAISIVIFFSLLSLVVCANEKPLLKFIENKNQWEADVYYQAKINGGYLSLTQEGFNFHFFDYKRVNELHYKRVQTMSEGGEESVMNQCIEASLIKLTFLNGQSTCPQAFGQSSEYYNYFLKEDPTKWGSKAFAYTNVTYPEFYKGIDLKVYSEGPNAKYDWIVKPGEDPAQIKWSYQGADSLYLQHGSLYATTALADIIERKPYSYQIKNGITYEIKIEFVLNDHVLQYSFPEGYDECYELVIDPLLIFSTYSGATADNWGSSATPGEQGRLYSTGVVRDLYAIAGGQQVTGELSKTAGTFQIDNAGGYDIAIFKYDSTGRELIYATYLGGGNTDSPHSLLMNNNNELLVLGTTSSTNFPTTSNAFSRQFNGGTLINASTVPYNNGTDLILSRISADGATLLSSTYIGGTANDGLSIRGGILTKNYGDEQRGDIIVDEQDNVYVSTVTSSTDFPVLNSVQTTYNGGTTDALVFKMDKELSAIEWGTYLGGSGTDASYSIKFDSDKNIVVAGGTSSADFPSTPGVYQTAFAGNADGWVTRLAGDGSTILQSTFTGTNSFDQVYFIDLDESDEIYLYGQTTGSFPVTAGVFSNPNSGQFIQKLSKNLSTLRFSTVFGSGTPTPNISPTAFLVNDCNNIYVAGWGGSINSNNGFWISNTNNMPITSDALQSTTRGSDFYFLVLTADASEMLYGTYLGGNQSSIHVDGGTSRFDKGGVVYHAVCAGCGGGNDDFPTTSTAWSRLNNSQNCNNAAFKFDLSSLTARLQTNNLTRDMPGISRVCIPDPIVFQNFSTGGEIFEWDLGNGETRVFTDTASFVYFYNNPGTYVVTLTAIDQGTCKVRDVATKTILVDFAKSEVQDDDAICEGDSYQLKASGGATYQWVSEDKLTAFAGPNPIIAPTKTTSYIVTIAESSGCIQKDTVTIEVVPGIVPEFILEREVNCLMRPYVSVKNPKADSTDFTFIFDFGDGTQSDLPETEHLYEEDNTYNVKLIAQRDFCVFEQTQTVGIATVFMPNVITPLLKEGKNDVFTIHYGTENRTPAEAGLKVALLVYNRWGTTVYESTDYQYNWSGEDLVSGVYFYEVTIEGYATCKDWIHVIK